MKSDLDIKFEKAYQEVSKIRSKVAPDIMLRFYAFNKQATAGNNFSFNASADVRNGFKFNAWMQLSGMSSEDAKKAYIKLAKKIINQSKIK